MKMVIGFLVINMNKKEYMKKYYQENKEQLKENKISWRKKHAEQIKKYNKKYREEHKKEISEYQLKYYYNNYEKAREWAKKSYYNNREKRIIYNLKYYQKLNNKILINLRIRIWKVLKGINKSSSTLELLGYDIEQLKQYFENKFKTGMSWENYGKWHIDHIIPCVSFDLSKVSEQKKCFNYKNLQPLWAEDNLSKNDKILGE